MFYFQFRIVDQEFWFQNIIFKIHSKFYPRKNFTKFEFRELME